MRPRSSTGETTVFTQFTRFASVGVIATAVLYIILIALAEGADADPILASAIGYALGAFTGYYLNYRYTFDSTKRHPTAMLKFFVIAAVGLFFNILIMHLLIKFLSFHYIVAQVVATILVLVWNFSANRTWTFRDDSHVT